MPPNNSFDDDLNGLAEALNHAGCRQQPIEQQQHQDQPDGSPYLATRGEEVPTEPIVEKSVATKSKTTSRGRAGSTGSNSSSSSTVETSTTDHPTLNSSSCSSSSNGSSSEGDDSSQGTTNETEDKQQQQQQTERPSQNLRDSDGDGNEELPVGDNQSVSSDHCPGATADDAHAESLMMRKEGKDKTPKEVTVTLPAETAPPEKEESKTVSLAENEKELQLETLSDHEVESFKEDSFGKVPLELASNDDDETPSGELTEHEAIVGTSENSDDAEGDLVSKIQSPELDDEAGEDEIEDGDGVQSKVATDHDMLDESQYEECKASTISSSKEGSHRDDDQNDDIPGSAEDGDDMDESKSHYQDCEGTKHDKPLVGNSTDDDSDETDRVINGTSEDGESSIVPYGGAQPDEVHLVEFDPGQVVPVQQGVICTVIQSPSSQAPVPPASLPGAPLDPEEDARRRQEVDTAMEILEHMRRANLVLEFGPRVDLGACVFCLREQRRKDSRQQQQQRHQHQNNPGIPQSLKRMLPKKKLKQCLICHSPVCKNHWDMDFVAQQNVILCPDCAPLFDLDNLAECMNVNASDTLAAPNKSNNQIVAQKQEQHIRQLLILYDRALLALRHSSQSFDDNARQRIAQTNWHKEGLGIGSCVSNIASGVTGIAATAVFMTPMGPWLLLTSLALGGFATAVGSGSFLVGQLCNDTRQAEQTIALASMVDSLLEAHSILRQARITGSMPSLASKKKRTEDKNSSEAKSGLPQLTVATSKYLQEDTDQQLMITIIKAKKDREESALNPLQRIMKHVNKRNAEEQRRQRFRQRDHDTTDDLDESEESDKQGRWNRLTGRIRKNMAKAKDKAAEAAVVAQAATALTAVGMAAGRRGGLVPNVPSRRQNSSRKQDEQSSKNGAAGSEPTNATAAERRTSAGLILGALLLNPKPRSTKTHRQEKDDKDERALVSKEGRKSAGLKLRASAGILKKLSRTRHRVAAQRGERRQQLMRNDSNPRIVGAMDRVFVKNARFCVKASLTVLRETARYAGGAFSAAIVCVETMELKEKVDRIRTGGQGSDAVDKIDNLKHHLWMNQSSFPDTLTLESELFANYKKESPEKTDASAAIVTPHWSSLYEGERPDGSCANLPIIESMVPAQMYQQ